MPRVDFLSFTVPGAPWLDHEWLAELLTWLPWRTGGAWAVLLLYTVIITATFALVGVRMHVRDVPPLVSTFLLLGALLAAGGSIGMRMQMFSLLLLAVLLLILEKARSERAPRLLFYVPPLLCLWANLHGGFMIGLAVLGIALCGSVIERISAATEPRPRSGPLALALVASTLATLLNPNGVAALIYPFRFLKRNPFTTRIAESLPPAFNDPVTIAFGVLVSVLLLSLLLSQQRVNVTDLLLAGAFTLLAFSQARNIAVWVVAVLPITASAITGAVGRFRNRAKEHVPIQAQSAALINGALLTIVIAAYTLIAVNYLDTSRLAAMESEHFPLGAVAILKNDHRPHRVFCDYEWGGYVSWALGDRGLVFIDGRADTVYPTSVLDQYLSIASGLAGWHQELTKYGADAVILPPSAPLARLLVTDAQWEIAYADRLSVLYVRSSPARL
ncbi:MAG: hypothetical protein ABI718_09665 [Acidobacteriota bacterium]